MNITYLKEFEVLAETGNYMEAAEKLYISQSTLSKHIKSMENELGVPLFIRTTRKISLSPFGDLLLEDSKKITQTYMSCMDKIAVLREDTSSELSIGSFSMLSSYGISDLLIGFSETYPSIKTRLNKYAEPTIIQKLENKELDLAFIHESPTIDEKFEKIPIAKDHLCLVVPSDHPLASRKSVSISELSGEQFIIPPSRTFLNMYFQTISELYGLPLDNAVMVNDIYSIISMVSRGMGISLLSYRSYITLDNPNVVSVNLEEEYSVDVYLIYLKDSCSQAVYHFVNYVKDQIS